MSIEPLQPGDRIHHPAYGFGVIEGVATLEQNGQAVECYRIRMAYRGRLTVPIDHAEAVGLRVLVNGLARIAAGLRKPAHPLSENHRERGRELDAYWHDMRSEALTEGVRDLMSRERRGKLTSNDRRWLSSACERLSTEIALVDAMELFKARAAMQREIDLLKFSSP